MATNHLDLEDSAIAWKKKSKAELKKKIKSNLEKRGSKVSEIVNDTTKVLIPDIEQSYSQRALVSAALNDIFMNVDEWSGVNILAMSNAPKTFEQYHKRSDNWWNRSKAEWIGDYYFYPFFHTELRQYIEKIVNSGRVTNEFLYFMTLSNIVNAEIHYHRCRAQPLVLDKSFLKSRDLNHLFHQLGVKNCIPWQIPPRDNKNSGHYRTIVREFAIKWSHTILQEKQITYNKHIVTLNEVKKNENNTQSRNYCSKIYQVQTSNNPRRAPYVSQKHLSKPHLHHHTETYPIQRPRAPMRYHPYRVLSKTHNHTVHTAPILSAQCEIKVYTTECNDNCGNCNGHSMQTYRNNDRINTQSIAYTGTHGPSIKYIIDNHNGPLSNCRNAFVSNNLR